MSEDGILLIISVVAKAFYRTQALRNKFFTCITGLENDLPVSKRIFKVAGVVFVK